MKTRKTKVKKEQGIRGKEQGAEGKEQGEQLPTTTSDAGEPDLESGDQETQENVQSEAETVQPDGENAIESDDSVQNTDENVTEDIRSDDRESFTDPADPEEKPDRLPYLSEVSWGWHKHNFDHWKKLLYTEEPAMALEIGAFDGVSACTMADHFFPHPDSRIYTIDPFDNGDPSTPQTGPETETLFQENVKRGGHEGKVKLLKGYSEVVLRQIDLQESKEKFDFIFIDGAHDAKSVLKDAVLTFDLLKPGGILIFDDFEWTYVKGALNQPKAGVLAFESVFGDRLELVFSKWARCYRKK